VALEELENADYLVVDGSLAELLPRHRDYPQSEDHAKEIYPSQETKRLVYRSSSGDFIDPDLPVEIAMHRKWYVAIPTYHSH
jgi:hypothetical protein